MVTWLRYNGREGVLNGDFLAFSDPGVLAAGPFRGF
jgi:hypothetical protein